MKKEVYREWLREELFERAPLNISVIDREYRIVAANRNFVRLFGDAEGRKCYEVHMGRSDPCEGCSVAQTFADGRVRVNEEQGVDRLGHAAHYQVHVAPIRDAEGGIPYVIEMSTDISDAVRLRLEYQTLFQQVPCYVTVLDRELRIVRCNEMFRQTFGEPEGRRCFSAFKRLRDPCETCPARLTFEDGRTHTEEQVGIAKDGRRTHYIVTTAPANREGDAVEQVIEMAIDVTEVHRLRREKIKAERLAAVGQTVAGLAHGIKNILTGLEGGMYFVRSALKGGRAERLGEGWGMLERNMERISVLVRNLLSFSKGRVPKVEMLPPGRFLREMGELYREAAAREGVEIVLEEDETTTPAPLDAEGIHTCLANLVSNAIDACQMSDRRPCRIFLRVRDEDGALVFEVEDEGIGMDQKVRELVFTNFFTTKGAGGTGLGLLLTRKITVEHGGRIEFESKKGVGSVFRLIFPRESLPLPGGQPIAEEQQGGT